MITRRKALLGFCSQLEQNTVDSPRLSAEVLFAESLGLSRGELFIDLEKMVTNEEFRRAQKWVRRRSEGEPVAYITGYKEFYGRDFSVDPRVLIPRPETELIIDLVSTFYPSDQPFVFTDIGVGSGALAGTIACERKACTGIATDLDFDALTIAAHNLGRLSVGDRISLARMEIASGLASGMFDLVVSNPPYLSDDDMRLLSREIFEYEPRGALYAGPKGTELAAAVIQHAVRILRPGGRLLMEIGAQHGTSVSAMLHATSGSWREIQVFKDLAGYDRVASAVRCG